MSAALTMEEVAAKVGLSRERFRKVWRGWTRTLAFPAPFREPTGARGRGTYAWREEAVDTWRLAREAALGQGHAAPAPRFRALPDAANDAADHPGRARHPAATARSTLARAAMLANMTRPSTPGA